MVRFWKLVFTLPVIALAWLAPAVLALEEDNESLPTTTTAPATTTTTTTTIPATTTTTTTTTTLPTHLDPVKTAEARDEFGQCGEFYEMALALGWPAEEWDTLSQIMWRESRCLADAWSGSDAGLLQINRIHTEWAKMMGWNWPDDLFVAENNLLFGYRLWAESGWRPWRFSGPVPGGQESP